MSIRSEDKKTTTETRVQHFALYENELSILHDGSGIKL